MTKKTLITSLKVIVPILFGIFLIGLTYNKTTTSERADVIKYIKEADYFWVVASIVLGLLSHASRAYRWKFTLEPLGYKPKFLNSFMAVMIAYFANLGIPRSGEILRATTLTTYEGVPFEKAFGTIVAERIADLVMSFVFIFIALILQYDMIIEAVTPIINLTINTVTSNPKLLFLIALICLSVIIIVYRITTKNSNRLITKIKTFVTGLKDGVLSIITMKHKWAFIAHTIFIWVMYFLMFYVIFFSIPETINTPISTALVSFVTGSFTMAATNGGLGSFPLVIQETLNLFNISNQSGLAIGWILWSAQTILNIVAGVASFFFLPIYNRTK
ncbi:MAG: lysylphosphatidylglycerol synthase transmembrane domain-containing protein [Flavobacteriaceae bacterium]